jgi:hypothetical protein
MEQKWEIDARTSENAATDFPSLRATRIADIRTKTGVRYGIRNRVVQPGWGNLVNRQNHDGQNHGDYMLANYNRELKRRQLAKMEEKVFSPAY